MGVFEQFPYTNFHGVNLSWILEKVRDHETRITSLESRMDAAEDDIDKLQADVGDVTQLHTTDKSSLVAAVNENEGRLDTAESDIDALEAQVPKAVAGDAGKVLTATGAGTATWQDVPKELPESLGTAGQVLTVNDGADAVEWAYPVIYVDYDDNDVPDPDDYIPIINRGQQVVLRHIVSNYTYYSGPAFATKSGSNHTQIFWIDPAGTFLVQTGIVGSDPHGLGAVVLSKDNGTCSWSYSGIYNQNYYSSSYT